LKTLLERHTEGDGDFERSLERRRVFILLNRYDGLPCDADFIRKFLLRHSLQGAECSDLIFYRGHQSAIR
jgi:hypothetical protein